MTLREQSAQLGYHYNHLSVIKRRYPKKWEFMESVGGPMKYREAYQFYQKEMTRIFYELTDDDNSMSISNFYLTHCKDMYSSYTSFNVRLNAMAFSNTYSLPSVKMYKKMERIIKEYEKYKKERKKNS